jgi:hypothetical protein
MIKLLSFRRFLNLASLLLIIILIAGCSGMSRVKIYAPIAPDLEPKIERSSPQKTWEKAKYSSVSFDLGNVLLNVYSVDLSEKMIMLFGPAVILPTPLAEEVIRDELLSISVRIKLHSGTVSFDPQDFVVLLDESNRLFSPMSIKENAHITREGKYISNEVTGPVILSEPSIEQVYIFTYDIPKINLPPFVFRLGELTIDGKVVRFPELPFEYDTRYISK